MSFLPWFFWKISMFQKFSMFFWNIEKVWNSVIFCLFWIWLCYKLFLCPKHVFWLRASSEAVLVKFFVCLFVSSFGQKVSCSIRKPKSLILHEKTGKSHPESENGKVSFSIRKPKSLIVHEKTRKSHSEWENRKVSFCMRKPESLIMHEESKSLILHEKRGKSHLAWETKTSYLA